MVSAPAPHSSYAHRHHGIHSDVKHRGKPESIQEKPVDPENPVLETQREDAPQPEKVRGVIRLLQEGHFKGVADVRLRINFHDELQAMEDKARGELVQGEVQQFEESITDRIESFFLEIPESGEGVEGVSGDDIEAVKEALSLFNAEKGQLSEDLVSDLTDRFNRLITVIQGVNVQPQSVEGDVVVEPPGGESGLVTPGEEEISVTGLVSGDGPLEENTVIGDVAGQNVEEPSVDEGDSIAPDAVATKAPEETPEEPSGWEALVLELRGLFDDFMAELDEKTTSLSLLPELSAPSGRGKAYDRFLAAYQELRGNPDGTVAQSESVDILV